MIEVKQERSPGKRSKRKEEEVKGRTRGKKRI